MKHWLTFLLICLLAACGPATLPPTATPNAAVTNTAPAPEAVTPAFTLPLVVTPLPYPGPSTPVPGPTLPPSPTPTRAPWAASGAASISVMGMESDVNGISFATARPWLAGVTRTEQNLMIWDYSTGALVRMIPKIARTGSESPAAFQPGSTLVATAAGDGNVTLWDASTGEQTRQLVGPKENWLQALAFSPDGKTLAGGYYRQVVLWDVASGQVRQTITSQFLRLVVFNLAFSPDGASLAIGTENGVLLLWERASGQARLIGYLESGRMEPGGLAFSPDGALLAAADPGSPATLWDAHAWTKRAILPGASQPGGGNPSVAFSPDGKTLAYAPGDSSVGLWNLNHLQRTASAALPVSGSDVMDLAFSPDGTVLAGGVWNQSVALWDARHFPPLPPPLLAALPPPTNDLTFVYPQPLESGQPVAICCVQMVDEKVGWGFADDGPSRTGAKTHLLRTTDGGQTWREVTLPGGPGSQGGFFALDANTAWTAPRYVMVGPKEGFLNSVETLVTWRTRDGGRTWQQSAPFSLARKGLGSAVSFYSTHFQFLDRNHGWLFMNVDCDTARLCSWQLYQTDDGGMHWQRVSDTEQRNVLQMDEHLYSVHFWDAHTAWGAGSLIGWVGSSPTWNASLYATSDGGKTWETFPLPKPDALPDAFHNKGMDCGAMNLDPVSATAIGVSSECVVYNDAYEHFRFYHFTPNQGKTWHGWESNGTEHFISATTGWRMVSGGPGLANHLLQTTDSGATWQEIAAVPWMSKLYFASETVGWAFASQAEARALLRTSDGGKTWVEVPAKLAGK